MKLLFKMLGWSLFLIVFYCLYYVGFSGCLSDDVEFYYGKSRLKKRKKRKGFWKKFLFLDIRKEVVPWHYAMFWINLVSFISMLITANVCIVYKTETVRIIFNISVAVFFLSCIIIEFVRVPLHLWVIVRPGKSYRETYRKKYLRIRKSKEKKK